MVVVVAPPGSVPSLSQPTLCVAILIHWPPPSFFPHHHQMRMSPAHSDRTFLINFSHLLGERKKSTNDIHDVQRGRSLPCPQFVIWLPPRCSPDNVFISLWVMKLFLFRQLVFVRLRPLSPRPPFPASSIIINFNIIDI